MTTPSDSNTSPRCDEPVCHTISPVVAAFALPYVALAASVGFRPSVTVFRSAWGR
jgi:hypothetical protein